LNAVVPEYEAQDGRDDPRSQAGGAPR
jgi:hypothetical protein